MKTKKNKIIILLLSIAFVFCAGFLATALVNDYIGGSNNQSKNESDTLLTDNGLIDKDQIAKGTEYNAFYDNVEKETFELLSKYTNAKFNVTDKTYHITDASGKTKISMTDEYVLVMDKACEALLKNDLSYQEAQLLFVFTAENWDHYVEAKKFDNIGLGKEFEYPSSYYENYFKKPLEHYLKIDDRLIGDIRAAFDPDFYWTKGAPFGNADRLEK